MAAALAAYRAALSRPAHPAAGAFRLEGRGTPGVGREAG